MSDNPSGKTYIGMAYNKETNVESSNPMDYTWSKFVGADGLDGADGLPGTNGLDGKTYYVWIKYADSPTSGMSDNPNGKAYIGVAYNKLTPTESTNYGDYSWSKIKGETGPQGNTGPQGPQGPPGSDANVPSYIQSTKIAGTRVESCELAGNTITGGTIKGVTIIGGDEKSIYTSITPSEPFSINRINNKKAVEIWNNPNGGSSYIYFYPDPNYENAPNFTFKNGPTPNGNCEVNANGQLKVTGDGLIVDAKTSDFKLYANARSSTPYIEAYRSYMRVGNPFIETIIEGTTVEIKNWAKGLTFSEMDVRMMELEHENRQLGLKQSEMEVTLMERGIL